MGPFNKTYQNRMMPIPQCIYRQDFQQDHDSKCNFLSKIFDNNCWVNNSCSNFEDKFEHSGPFIPDHESRIESLQSTDLYLK